MAAGPDQGAGERGMQQFVRRDHEPDSRTAELRVPPHSIDAEQSVLGALMLDNGSWDQVGDVVADADFYRHRHRLIFRAIESLAQNNEPFDVVTLSEWLDSRKQLEDVGGLAYLGELSEDLAAQIPDLEYPEAVAAASKTQIDALAREYLRRLEALSQGLPRVTDKLPHNFTRVGLIALCLPAAKVIHIRRHPLDTCLSIYFQNQQPD